MPLYDGEDLAIGEVTAVPCQKYIDTVRRSDRYVQRVGRGPLGKHPGSNHCLRKGQGFLCRFEKGEAL